jgi:hypothetical protein
MAKPAGPIRLSSSQFTLPPSTAIAPSSWYPYTSRRSYLPGSRTGLFVREGGCPGRRIPLASLMLNQSTNARPAGSTHMRM